MVQFACHAKHGTSQRMRVNARWNCVTERQKAALCEHSPNLMQCGTGKRGAFDDDFRNARVG
jgi:hypothetical protein